MRHAAACVQPIEGLELERADAVRLLEIIQECAACRSQPAFSGLVRGMQALFPFDHALALTGRLNRGVALAEGSVNAGFPEGWLRAYADSGRLGRDALVRCGFEGRAIRHWSDAAAFLDEPNALQLCRDFGMGHGYVAGHGPFLGSASSLFCFAGTGGKQDARACALLRLLVPHLHLALQLAQAETLSRRLPDATLSDREKEVLGWFKEGKSSWDVGMILGISERTVNFHAANVMRKLGATNRAQAVAVALGCGLIAVD